MSTETLWPYVDLYLVPFGIKLLLALLVFFFGRVLSRVVVRLLDKVLARGNIDTSLRKFLSDVASGVLFVVVVIASLDQLGVETTAALAVLGAMGLAIGLALKDSLGNFAAGVMLLLLKPYRVGDYVNVAGQGGTVESTRIFHTVLITPDNRKIVIPNGSILGGVIENITAMPTRRVDLVFRVGYGDDLKKVEGILRDLIAADERIQAEPEPFVAVTELADTSVNFTCRAWTDKGDYWGVKHDLIRNAKDAFDAAGVSAPVPQREIHVINQTKAA